MSALPILTFHSVDPSGSIVSMSEGELRRILAGLAEAGWRGVTVSEALAAPPSPPPPRVMALTFDDGYANVCERVGPILAEFGFTATVFVIAGRVGLDNRWAGQLPSIPTMPLANWQGLESLAGAGWEIGSHGVAHLPLTLASSTAAVREVEESQDLLARTLGRSVPVFAYPYGVVDARARALVRARYTAACGARLALASGGDVDTPLELPRLDAHYLRRFPPVTLDGIAGRGYLALRRWIRRLRADPWDASALGPAVDG